jgi:uncharacterized Zn-binding protein involved in type VI secretion
MLDFSTKDYAKQFQSLFRSVTFVIPNNNEDNDVDKSNKIHWVATIGSTTERGGRILKVSSGAEFNGFRAALVGDTVTYDDRTEATILDGSGFGATWANKPFALVGSRLSNGDRITTTPQSAFGITEKEGETIPGLFESGYVPPYASDSEVKHA